MSSISNDELDTPATSSHRKAAAIRIEGRLLDFLLAVFSGPIVRAEGEKLAPISSLLVLAIKPDDSWVQPMDYTPLLSAVITLGKLFICYIAYLQYTASKEALLASGASEEEAIRRTKPVILEL